MVWSLSCLLRIVQESTQPLLFRLEAVSLIFPAKLGDSRKLKRFPGGRRRNVTKSKTPFQGLQMGLNMVSL